ncbi:MAG: hypothetical protein HC836_23085 [Richelia sp. RM2_1_2]|nr:hypothetical protein [Richelia sp. RM2_1_2]
MVIRKPKNLKVIETKVVINGVLVSVGELPFQASIPDAFFKKSEPVRELINWLENNTQDIWYVFYNQRIVKFKLEDDAILLKLTHG